VVLYSTFEQQCGDVEVNVPDAQIAAQSHCSNIVAVVAAARTFSEGV
jgi:hypothetical protein